MITGKRTTFSKASYLAMALLFSCAALPPLPSGVRARRNAQSRAHAWALAPQLKAQTAVKPEEISESGLANAFSAMIEEGHRPFIIMDKDGTVTARNGNLGPMMAERIINLLALGCPMALLSANTMRNIKPQFIDYLTDTALPKENAIRRSRGLSELGPEIFAGLTVCTTNGAQTWTFDKDSGAYLLAHQLDVDRDYYNYVKTILATVREFFLDHPLYGISESSQIIDTDVQLTLSAISLQSSRQQYEAFRRRELDTQFTFGYNKRQIWINTIKDLLAAHAREEQDLASELLEQYAHILSDMVSDAPHRARLEALLAEPEMANFKNGALAKVLLDMLEIMDGECRLLADSKQHAKTLRSHILRTSALIENPTDADSNRIGTIRKRVKNKKGLLRHWRQIIRSIEDLPDKTIARHSRAALMLAADVSGHRGKPSMPFVENGGNRSIDIKFSSKGQSIDALLRRRNAMGRDTVYFGDEFFPDGGDLTALESRAEFFVDVGPKTDIESAPHNTPSRVCSTPDTDGPPAAIRIFDSFIGTLTPENRAAVAAAA